MSETPSNGGPGAGVVDALKERLRASITAALKARDRERLAVLRQTLAAIENAEAPQMADTAVAEADGPIAGSRRGIGAGDAPRRVLGPLELRQVLDGELAEHLDAAAQAAAMGRDELTSALRRQAEVVRALLASLPPG